MPSATTCGRVPNSRRSVPAKTTGDRPWRSRTATPCFEPDPKVPITPLLFDVLARETPRTVKASGGQTPTFSILRKAGIACCSDPDLLSRIRLRFPRPREGRAFKKSREVIGVSRYQGPSKVPVLGHFVRSERRYI